MDAVRYALYVAIVLAYILILIVQLWGIRIFVRVLAVPPHLLTACIIVLCVLGSVAFRFLVDGPAPVLRRLGMTQSRKMHDE